jgi:hypothetical protein
MPYFERKPFEELHPPPGGQQRYSKDPAGPVTGPSVLVEKAAAIFRQESHSLPDWSARGRSIPVPAGRLPGGLPPATRDVTQAPARLFAAPAPPGQRVSVPISLINDTSDDVPYTFSFTDLVSSTGVRIPYTAVGCVPEKATVPARSALNAEFKLLVPNVPAGEYVGLVTCGETQPAVLTITVSA